MSDPHDAMDCRDPVAFPLTHPLPAFDPAWRTRPVLDLAGVARRDRAYHLLPILADALEEAGCADPAILQHCRRETGHEPGCWVVELVLAGTAAEESPAAAAAPQPTPPPAPEGVSAGGGSFTDGMVPLLAIGAVFVLGTLGALSNRMVEGLFAPTRTPPSRPRALPPDDPRPPLVVPSLNDLPEDWDRGIRSLRARGYHARADELEELRRGGRRPLPPRP